jgi:hypothetical protein
MKSKPSKKPVFNRLQLQALYSSETFVLKTIYVSSEKGKAIPVTGRGGP